MRKRMLALAIALCMVLSLSVPALAAEDAAAALMEEGLTVQPDTEPIEQEPAEEEAAEKELPTAEDAEPAEETPVEESEEEESEEEEEEEESPVEESVQPEALTLEDTVPEITDITVSSGGTSYSSTDGGNIIVKVPSDSLLSSYTVTVTLSDDGVLTPTPPTPGDLYVVSADSTSATFQFNLSLDIVDLNTST